MLGSHQRGRFSHIGRNVQVVNIRSGHKERIVVGRYLGPSLPELTDVEPAQRVIKDSSKDSNLVSQNNELNIKYPFKEVLVQTTGDGVDLLVKPQIKSIESDLLSTSTNLKDEIPCYLENDCVEEHCYLDQSDVDLYPKTQTAISDVQSVATIDVLRSEHSGVSFCTVETGSSIQMQSYQICDVIASMDIDQGSVNDLVTLHFQESDNQGTSKNSLNYYDDPIKSCISLQLLEEDPQKEANQIKTDNWTRLMNSHGYVGGCLDHYSEFTPSEDEFNYLVEYNDDAPRISDFRSSSPCLSTSSEWTSNSRPSDVTLDYFLRTDDVFDVLTSDDEQSLSGVGCPSTGGAVVSGTSVSVNTGVSVPVHSTDERDHLMWCPDGEFDAAVSALGIRGLIEVVQGLQEAMAVEQQTFDTLTMQLEGASDPLLQQRLSAALCTSQTRLARLCARNMRCFTQQALKSRQKDPSQPRSSLQHSLSTTSLDTQSSNITKTNITSFDLESAGDKMDSSSFCSPLGANNPTYKSSSSFDCRAASPRDSGLAVSSTAGSDIEHDFKSSESVSSSPAPPTESVPGGASFKHSLAFFQRAAHLVTARNVQSGVRQKESRRRRSRGSSSGVDSAGSDCWSDTASEDLQSRSLDRLRDVRITPFSSVNSSTSYANSGPDSKFLFGDARINYTHSKTLSSDLRSRYNDSSGGRGGRTEQHLTAERARSLGRENDAPGSNGSEIHYSAVADRAKSLGRDGSGKDDVMRRSTDDFSSFGAVADPGTYEQVLFINGRPQYQDDFRRSYSCEALDIRAAPSSTTSSSSTTTTIKINPPSSHHHNRFLPEADHHSTSSSTTISSDGVWTRVHLDGSGSSSAETTADVPSPSNCSSTSLGSNVTSAASLVCGVSRVTRERGSAAADNTSAVVLGSGGTTDCFYTAVSGKITSATGGNFGGVSPNRSSSGVTTSAIAGNNASSTSSSVSASCVTLPRRKPYLNLKSVTTGSGSSVVNIYGSGTNINRSEVESETDVFGGNRESIDFSRINGVNIKRAHSFKDGLDDSRDATPTRAYPLLRTQSYSDGLAGDSDHHSNKPSLSRAPSIDEILESVRNLRAKKTMVNSSPDLYQNGGEPIYHSASIPRNKSSKKNGRTSAIIGVRYSSKSSDHMYDRVPEPHYEQIIENGDHYYENLHKDTHYENINNKSKHEVIYDRPRSNKPVENQYDQVHGDLHYENVQNYDLAVYENLSENEPTYMNVHNSNSTSRSKKSSRSKDSKTDSHRSSKSRSKSSRDCSPTEGLTYDIPRSATHIYDTPKKYSRPVDTSDDFAEYATPKNNRSVKSNITDSVRIAKQDQKQKIDDIFADVDRDSLDGDCDLEPDIPPPDYGPEEEEDQLCGEYPDEGLGESDGRSYYTEEQGLEVILEEPEEDYCSSPVGSHSGEDLYGRGSNLRLKGERGSLDGSEGIGSAEGDSSAGGSDHYPEEEEEDCASSGIHSQDTPSPGTPVDQFKEDNVELPPTRQEERVQQDRSLDVYPETLRQRQRHRNMAPSPSKVDIKNWNQNGTPTREPESPASGKKFLPSVKALRSQFETGKNLNSSNFNNGSVSPTSTFSMSSSSSNASTGSTQGCGNGTPTSVGGGGLRAVADPTSNLARKLSGSSLASSSLEKSSSNTSLNSAPSTENLLDGDPHDPDEPVEPIFCQFQKVDEELRELMSRPTSTSGWDPRSLLKRLYYVPEVPRIHSKGHSYVNIEGYLEKLPSGRKKATFWNAWKRRYFVAKDGVLYYYQNSQCDKQSLRLTLMGGKVETMEGNMVGVDDGVTTPADKAAMMLGIDDGKGHYVVVRCSSRSEAERWRRALESHLVEDFASQYVQPHPMPTNPSLLRDTLIIDIGSCSVRAGVLTSQATLPQLFFPSVVAIDRESRRQVWGQDALAPETRSSASISFPMKPSHRISKYSVDLTALSSLLAKTFMDLKVDPKNYNLQISVPRVLNQHTQSELLRTLFEKFGVKGVNVTHQSILALYAYNATSGIVVDIGERMEIVPVIDGYIVEGGVSRVPYGGCRILDHLRQFLYMRNVSLVNDVESYIIRHVLESACYSAQHYNTEKARCTNHPENFEKSVSLKEFFPSSAQCPYDAVELDFGRFQATEGIFNPDAWGLDHPGLHKLVHKAIQECSMDIRKEMSRSIFLAGGVTQLPGLADRLTTELDNLTPPAIRPKVHVSPYRYHAAYIGACTLAESPAFSQTLITRENWAKNGNAALRKWAL